MVGGRISPPPSPGVVHLAVYNVCARDDNEGIIRSER